MLGTVKSRELRTGSEEEWSRACGSVWEEYGGTLMDAGATEILRGRKSRLLEVVGSGMVPVERLRLWGLDGAEW